MKQYTDRAKWRLKCARQLLQCQPAAYGFPKGWRLDDGAGFFEAIVEVLGQLAPDAAAKLQFDVDWLEGYEEVEAEPTQYEMRQDRRERWNAWMAAQEAGRAAA